MLILAMLLVCVALVPAAVSAKEETDYSISTKEAFRHANANMVEYIVIGALDSEIWEGAYIDPKSLELYDINGQKLFYEFSVYKDNILIGRIDISANKTLGNSLQRIEIDPKNYKIAEAVEKSKNTANKNYPTGKIKSTKIVVYDYPEVGAMTVVKEKNTGIEHRVFVDAYTLEEVQDKPATEMEIGVWSMYEQAPKNKIDDTLKEWQNSEKFTDKFEQKANNMGININEQITEEEIEQLNSNQSANLSANSNVISSATGLSYKIVYYSKFPLCNQTKKYYCIPACAQMIAKNKGYTFTQDYIYKQMGGTNGNTTGIYPSKALTWYKKTKSEGGLGATRSSLSSDRFITKAVSEIDLGRPFNSMIVSPDHCRVCAGYCDSYNATGKDSLYIVDPAGRRVWETLGKESQRLYVIF